MYLQQPRRSTRLAKKWEQQTQRWMDEIDTTAQKAAERSINPLSQTLMEAFEKRMVNRVENSIDPVLEAINHQEEIRNKVQSLRLKYLELIQRQSSGFGRSSSVNELEQVQAQIQALYNHYNILFPGLGDALINNDSNVLNHIYNLYDNFRSELLPEHTHTLYDVPGFR